MTADLDATAELEPAPSIAPVPALYMAAHIRRAGAVLGIGGRAEVGFACAFDLCTKTITRARAISWGRHNRTIAPVLALRAGDLFVHNHVDGLHPSPPDLDAANDLAARGIGLGIVDDDAARLYVVTEPRPVDAGVRPWIVAHVGRWLLLKEPGAVSLRWGL